MRTAILVDAGYLYAAGSSAISHGIMPRRDVDLSVKDCVIKLKKIASEKSGNRALLRIYWYDGALSGGLSPEHTEIANTNDVKLRLGAIAAYGKQKGVDSLIVADLIDLARNRAVSDVVLMSGDEDTRIGVQIAQSFGVRVHLLGIVAAQGNQSRSLIQESDTATEWSPDDIREFLTPKTMFKASADGPIKTGTETYASRTSDQEKIEQGVAEFVALRSPDELSKIAALGPQSPIPHMLDRELLKTCTDKLDRRLDEPEKHHARKELKRRARERAAS